MRPLPTLLALVAAAAFGGLAAVAIGDGLRAPAQAQDAPAPVFNTPAATPAGAREVPPGLVGGAALPMAVDGQPMPSLAPMLQRVTPAVVSVNNKRVVRVSPFGNDPFFRRMFPELSQERIAQSLGSGVIVDAARGYVLTNHHVIQDADEVTVTLADGRTLEAEFLGSDAETDVALMRVQADGLTEVPLADSSMLSVGDFVVAVGNPFGVGQTVTSGIVSAVGRSNIPGVGFQNFIQTDASINPGNSGGALVNLRGELVGINTASFNPRGSEAGNIGLGFAIPSNLAGSVMRQLIATGEVRRGTLGVDTQTVDARLAEGLGLEAPRGAVVTRVHPGSAAAEAGLQTGDVIVGANGQRVDNSESLRNIQGLQAIDTPVTLQLLRDGRPLEITARLREVPHDGASYDARLAGATLADLPEALRRASNRVSGVLVEAVEPGSRAARNGLRAGDVILAATGGQFHDLAGFRAVLSNAPDEVVLLVQRGRSQGQVQLR
ncbi:Do family serine endopeptidase [Luteimonas sp. RD2P54]|uniref:Do family serine endopeptidase n=1 Tax=Luteimonas endophytica TaxID=3042023 RepID=A0ABT6JFJ0_9GAMM|nr:Do family serine endopeptidase [Luteimonas endophytica]MDH5824938.1 Do family serine endopeptidase [Luteimonas endophytica]